MADLTLRRAPPGREADRILSRFRDQVAAETGTRTARTIRICRSPRHAWLPPRSWDSDVAEGCGGCQNPAARATASFIRNWRRPLGGPARPAPRGAGGAGGGDADRQPARRPFLRSGAGEGHRAHGPVDPRPAGDPGWALGLARLPPSPGAGVWRARLGRKQLRAGVDHLRVVSRDRAGRVDRDAVRFVLGKRRRGFLALRGPGRRLASVARVRRGATTLRATLNGQRLRWPLAPWLGALPAPAARRRRRPALRAQPAAGVRRPPGRQLRRRAADRAGAAHAAAPGRRPRPPHRRRQRHPPRTVAARGRPGPVPRCTTRGASSGGRAARRRACGGCARRGRPAGRRRRHLPRAPDRDRNAAAAGRRSALALLLRRGDRQRGRKPAPDRDAVETIRWNGGNTEETIDTGIRLGSKTYWLGMPQGNSVQAIILDRGTLEVLYSASYPGSQADAEKLAAKVQQLREQGPGPDLQPRRVFQLRSQARPSSRSSRASGSPSRPSNSAAPAGRRSASRNRRAAATSAAVSASRTSASPTSAATSMATCRPTATTASASCRAPGCPSTPRSRARPRAATRSRSATGSTPRNRSPAAGPAASRSRSCSPKRSSPRPGQTFTTNGCGTAEDAKGATEAGRLRSPPSTWPAAASEGHEAGLRPEHRRTARRERRQPGSRSPSSSAGSVGPKRYSPNTAGSYALVGPLGVSNPPLEESSSALTGKPARISGVLKPDRLNLFVPVLASPTGSTPFELSTVAYQAPQAWPHSQTAGEKAALAYIAEASSKLDKPTAGSSLLRAVRARRAHPSTATSTTAASGRPGRASSTGTATGRVTASPKKTGTTWSKSWPRRKASR